MAEQYKFPDELDDEKTSQVNVSVEDDGDVEVEVVDELVDVVLVEFSTEVVVAGTVVVVS